MPKTHSFTTISNLSELKARVVQLKQLRQNEEQELKTIATEIYHSFQVLPVLKQAYRRLTADGEVGAGLKKTGIQLGVDFLIGKLFGRTSSVKGYFSSILFGKLSQVLTNTYFRNQANKKNATLVSLGQLENSRAQTREPPHRTIHS